MLGVSVNNSNLKKLIRDNFDTNRLKKAVDEIFRIIRNLGLFLTISVFNMMVK